MSLNITEISIKMLLVGIATSGDRDLNAQVCYITPHNVFIFM